MVLRIDRLPAWRAPTAAAGSTGSSLEVRAGEIVGVAGVEGNGQRALGDVLSSLIALDRGSVRGRPDGRCATGAPGAMSARRRRR